MYGVEPLRRQLEPFPVQAVDNIMGEHKKQRPPEQQTQIHYSAPTENVTQQLNCHG
jgi:hypothetical protein